MKRFLFLPLILLLVTTESLTQTAVCRGDTISIRTAEFRGEHYWQKSLNGEDWSRIDHATDRLLELIPTVSAYYRYEVYEGTCNPIHSEAIHLLVNEPPVVILENLSMCLDVEPFAIASGSPDGGVYAGPGIVDGKFVPQMAGPGSHRYSYTYSDPETTCSTSAFATIEVKPLPSEADAGIDSLNIVQDSIQLYATIPTEGTGEWTILSGEGGSFSDPADPQSWFFRGVQDRRFVLQWTVENPCGINSDELELAFVELSINPCPGTPLVFDQDGHRYPTVQIGDQCWMAKNLITGTTITSTVRNSPHSNMTDNGVVERYVWENDEANLDLYGAYYEWDEMMGYTQEEGAQGICPEGWHIPSMDDWNEMGDYLKTDVGTHLKEGGMSGFEGKLAGDRHSTGIFVSLNSSGFFWSSSTYSYNGANDGWILELCACNSYLDEIHLTKKTGASVRCIKDRE